MKKNKLSLGLITSFIAAMGLTACADAVTSSKDAVVTFKDYDGNEIGVITDEMFEEYSKSPAGISKFYDAIMEVLIRYEFKKENNRVNSPDYTGETPYIFDKTETQVKQEAERKIEDKKESARNDAKNNGTTFDKEWEAILDGEGVETEKELLEKYIYAIEKSQVEDWFFEDQIDTLTSEYIGVDATGKAVESDVSAKLPYHIRHILVKIGSGASNFYNGTITTDEAKSLSSTVQALVDGKNSFGETAFYYSADEGSATKYGDVGIMSTETSFVNEFKLGIYAYDAVLSRTTANTAINEGLGITTEIASDIKDLGLTYVPYAAIKTVGLEKDTKDSKGILVNNGNENYYPRNIYWNKYLNHHNPFVITNNALNVDGVTGVTDPTSIDLTNNYTELTTLGKCGFRKVPGITTGNQMVLTDEAGRVIVGVRSEHGIHLMVMQKSIFDFNNGEGANVSLNQYYTTLTPQDAGYPKNGTAPKDTYVNYLQTADQVTLNDRAKEVETAIRSFDPTYGYRLYDYLIKENNVTFVGGLKEQINEYIEAQREYNVWKDQDDMAQAWRTYLELLEVQEANRTAQRLIPETCAIRFKNASSNGTEITDAAFKEGGICYYAN